MNLSLGNLQELVMDQQAWHTAVLEVAKSWTWLSDWTELRTTVQETAFQLSLRNLSEEVRGEISIYVILEKGGFPGGSEGKESTCNVGDPGSILG